PALFQASELSSAAPSKVSNISTVRVGSSSLRNTAKVALMMPAPTITTSGCDTGRFSAMHSSHQDRKANSPYERLRQRDHAAPELLTLAGIDIVLAHKSERAVGIDAVDRDTGGQRLDRVAFTHQQRLDARRQQQPPAHIDAEGAQLDAVTFDRLD